MDLFPVTKKLLAREIGVGIGLEDMGLALGLRLSQFPDRDALDRMRLAREGE